MKNRGKRSINSPQADGGTLVSLRPFLESLTKQFNQARWLDSDPVVHVHRYERVEDREVVGFIAACFAYGSVTLIHRAIERILAPMGEHPARFIREYDGTNHWPGFYHRFHHDGHVVVLVKILQTALREYGSLGEMFFCKQNNMTEPGDATSSLCEQALNGAARWLRHHASLEVTKSGRPELERGMRFLFNAPEDGSACKRMVMFMRWMVRHDEIDVGLWRWLKPADLVIPADTHVGRISYYLGLRGGREDQAPNWRMAKEITESLRRIDAQDPVRFDFALARLGILDICKREYRKSVCGECPLEPGCRYSNLARSA